MNISTVCVSIAGTGAADGGFNILGATTATADIRTCIVWIIDRLAAVKIPSKHIRAYLRS